MTAEIRGTERDQWSLRLLAKVFIPSLTGTLSGILTAAQISAGNLNKVANASLIRGNALKQELSKKRCFVVVKAHTYREIRTHLLYKILFSALSLYHSL